MGLVHSLVSRLLAHLRRADLLAAGDRVGVAVSGGADSTALLRLLLELQAELGIVLSVVHFNHRLRGSESDQDEKFVAHLAHQHDLEFHLGAADTRSYAAEKHLSLESAARDLRYAYFAQLAARSGPQPCAGDWPASDGDRTHPSGERSQSHGKPRLYPLDTIATAHTLDDQAETVLMRVIRGTGLRGLGGIHPRVVVEGPDSDRVSEPTVEVIRPLLSVRRSELEAYLHEIGQDWREDASNRDLYFTRNRVRAQLLPLLEREFNPAITENLAELAEIARGEEDYWQNEISGWMGTGIHWIEPEQARTAHNLVQLQPLGVAPLEPPEPPPMDISVDRIWLLSEPLSVQRRILKAVGEMAGLPLEFRHVDETLRFAADEGPPGKRLSLPFLWEVARQPHALRFVAPAGREEAPADYAYSLALPGRAIVPEAGIVLEALLTSFHSDTASHDPDQLLDPAAVSKELTVRNWRPGDRYWPAHTKSPKKVKELLQEKRLTGALRKSWPLITDGENVVWLRGFPVPSAFQPRNPVGEAIWIRELDWDED